MKYSKEQLIELSKPYFESKPLLAVMYATTDNQFFYPESKSYANAHASSNNVEIITINRLEALKIKEEAKAVIIKEEAKEIIVEKQEEIKEPVITGKGLVKTKKK